MTATELTFDKVLSAYSGINGKCCCGCSGKHYTPSAKREERGASRGYPVDNDEINDRQVQRILNIVKGDHEKEKGAAIEYMEGDNNFATVRGRRLYIIYLS